MKKILIIANDAGGLYNFRKELVASLIQNGFIVTALIPFTARIKELKSLGLNLIEIPIDRRGTNPLHESGLLCRIGKYIRVVHPDLIITYTIKPNLYGGLISRLFRISYAVNITGLGTAFQNHGLLRRIVTILYKVSLKKAKVVFFENCENRDIFINEKILQRNKTCLLNGAGVNLEEFLYEEYPMETTPVRFLFIGRIMKEKGVNELFKAMKMLRKEGINCFLDVVGEFEENYKSIIQRFEKEGWLRYHGYQEDVRPFIKNCHCFVLPSWHEGMANTNLECAASGRPVITSNIHGCLEAVVDGKSGFLCEKQNARSLYEAMKKFAELPVEDRAEMGKFGREHMVEVFDKRKVVEKTINHLL